MEAVVLEKMFEKERQVNFHHMQSHKSRVHEALTTQSKLRAFLAHMVDQNCRSPKNDDKLSGESHLMAPMASFDEGAMDNRNQTVNLWDGGFEGGQH
jgi:hypothetical protein